jgi:uncharacterized protein (TIGR00730 family)
MHKHTHEDKVWKMSAEQIASIQKSSRKLRTSDEEFEEAFKILKKYPKRVTFFGSARISNRFKAYREAHDLAAMLAQDGFAIVSGGGGGVMEASNRGAFDEQHVSIGFNIVLPKEQHLNPYTTSSLAFNYFFTRKVMMTFYSHGFIFFPGGFGTFDEFFEVITIIQTGKMAPVPIILVGKKFWNPLDRYIKRHMLKNGLISKGDRKLYHITNDLNYARKIINEQYEHNKTRIENSFIK